MFAVFPPGIDRPTSGGCDACSAVGREDQAQRDQEPRRGQARGGCQQDDQAMGQLLHAGRGATALLRGCLRAAGEVQHVLPDRDQLDGRARLQAEEPRGAGGGPRQGGLGEACGE